MRYFHLCLILALYSTTVTSIHVIYSKAFQVLVACNFQITQTLTFCDELERFSCPCINENNMATVMGCAVAYDGSYEEFKTTYSNYCANYYTPIPSEKALDDALIRYSQVAVPTSAIPNFNATLPINVPIILDETARIKYGNSYFKFFNNTNTSIFYGIAIISYWNLVLLGAMISNWSKVLFPSLIHKLSGPISNKWRKYITLPAVYGKIKNQSLNFGKLQFALIPSRWETLVISGFVILSIIFNADISTYDPNDTLFDTKLNAICRYVADRTGITATFMVPLLILFAGRNNFLCFTTRIHYNTFIAYHKWIARISTILVVIHAVAYTIICAEHGYMNYIILPYFYWGVVATVLMCFLCGQAFLHLRRNWYEMFLLTHILFAVIFIIGGYYHVVDFGYEIFFHASVAVWGFDRIVRLVRLTWFGIANAEVSLLADETLRVVIPKPKRWTYNPGGYAYIHFLRPSCFWQSHPFTFTELPGNSNEIILYCKVKGGVTHGLYQYLATMPDCSATIKVTLEGPYGEAAPVKRHDTAVFIAGGNGIPGLYSEIVELLQNGGSSSSSDEVTPLLHSNNNNNSKQKIKLYWVIREYRSLIWFYKELMAIRGSKVQVVVYVTKPTVSEFLRQSNNLTTDSDTLSKLHSTGSNDSESSNESASLLTNRGNLDHIEFRHGRPDINHIVATEIEESAGSIGFVTCGHLMMVDDVRQAVVDNIDNGKGKRVDYFEQLETWA